MTFDEILNELRANGQGLVAAALENRVAEQAQASLQRASQLRGFYAELITGMAGTGFNPSPMTAILSQDFYFAHAVAASLGVTVDLTEAEATA